MNRERVCDTQDCEPASETLITSCTPDASGTSPQQFCAGSAKLVPLHASATHRDGACAVSVWFAKNTPRLIRPIRSGTSNALTALMGSEPCNGAHCRIAR